ncbi:hypothetical protein EI555_007963, partial [Monodon monoceros]
MSVVNVGSPLGKGPTFRSTREFTLEQRLTSAVNVGNVLAKTLFSLRTREFTLAKGLISAVNVETPEFTLEKNHMRRILNEENSLAKASSLLNTEKLTPQKGLISAADVEKFSVKGRYFVNSAVFTGGELRNAVKARGRRRARFSELRLRLGVGAIRPDSVLGGWCRSARAPPSPTNSAGAGADVSDS